MKARKLKAIRIRLILSSVKPKIVIMPCMYLRTTCCTALSYFYISYQFLLIAIGSYCEISNFIVTRMGQFCQLVLMLLVVGLLGRVEGITSSEAVKQFLVPQNKARQAVGVPPLTWNRTVTAYARNYARERRNDCLLQHSEGSPYGENIFWGSGPSWTPLQAVNAWIDEGKWYIHANNTCTGPDCTHYTQIVWRTTTSAGCAIIKCKNRDTWVICSYDPPGNYVGDRPY